MNTNNAINALKELSSKSKAASDFFHDCALRERTRGQITLMGLKLRMKRSGFEYSTAEYANILKAMADCGFGTLRLDSKGKIFALINVKTTLQSIGRAVVSGSPDSPLKNLAPRHKYSPLVASEDPIEVPKAAKAQVLRTLAGATSLIKAIVQDTDVSTDTKIKMLDALLK